MSNEEKIKLMQELYMHQSKHSSYQILPSVLQNIMQGENLQTHSRYEMERMEYIKKYIDFADCKVLDIGGNSGFFTFESLSMGAAAVDYYEGNEQHAEFVQKAVEVLQMEEKIHVYNKYFMFEKDNQTYDVILCLNVLHHLGGDFSGSVSMEEAKSKIISCINNMAGYTTMLVLQIGYNWCGDRFSCLFQKGTKEEMETFIYEGTKGCFDVVSVGIASQKNNVFLYEEKNEENNKRIDKYGEFLNRPLFILKSKKK